MGEHAVIPTSKIIVISFASLSIVIFNLAAFPLYTIPSKFLSSRTHSENVGPVFPRIGIFLVTNGCIRLNRNGREPVAEAFQSEAPEVARLLSINLLEYPA